jgi:hypothetical protein
VLWESIVVWGSLGLLPRTVEGALVRLGGGGRGRVGGDGVAGGSAGGLDTLADMGQFIVLLNRARMGYILSGAVLEMALVSNAASLEGEGNTLRHGGSEMGLLNVGHVGG